MVDPVRNWRQPFNELHPDLKKEIQFLRVPHGGYHFCIIHPDMLEKGNREVSSAHQLEAFRQAVEDVKIELNMNAIIDTSTMRLPDGRPLIIVQLVPHEMHPGTIPDVYPDDPAAGEKIGVMVDQRGKTVDPHGGKQPKKEEIIIQ